jgi:hypothetical protein
MKRTMTVFFLMLAWTVPCLGADAFPISKAAVQIRMSADTKVKAELASNLKTNLTALDGVTVGDQDPDFILDIMEVDEPMGRIAVSAEVAVPFGRKDNAKSFRELLARSWKSEFKDEDWKAFTDYLFPYRITVLRQLRSGRKGQMKKICAEIVRDFAVEVLKRKVETTETPGKEEGSH